MALFQSDLKDTVRKLSNKEFSTTEERDQLLTKLAQTEGLRARDVVWMLFRPDRSLRDAGVKILQRLKDPETVDLFAAECKTKPEAAVRAASGVLFSLGVPGLENRLVQLLAPPEKETKDTKEIQDAVRKIVIEAPPSPTLEPVLWQLGSTGSADDRLLYLAKLASLETAHPQTMQRWQKMATDPDRRIREKAVAVLAAKAPAASIDLLVQQLPQVGYATQQILVEALTRAATDQGAGFADRLLPLIASGDAATRSAVLKILMGMGDRGGVVKRYIVFSKTLAGFARDRALESMKSFGSDLLEPTLELLNDPDAEVRAAAIAVAGSFDDPRIVPATIGLLKDSDWWIRITAADTLGRLKDPRAVEPLIAGLSDPDLKWSAVEALGRIGDLRALPALGKLLADPQPDVRIEVIQAMRNFKHPQVLQVLQQVATTDQNRSVRTRALDIAEEIAARDKTNVPNAASLRNTALAATSGQGEPKLHALLVATRNQGASDFHLSVGQPPIVRIASDMLRAQGEPFTAEQTEAMLKEILTQAQIERLHQVFQLDFCYFIPQAGRYRANIFLDQKGYNGVFRVIPEKPPTINELGLPAHLSEIADYHQGLVIICGPSGSGKSTTLAALVNLFNETRHDHVLMMEDPVEFVHPFKNCLVNQREVGSHTQSFARALRAALREDPDVIVIGELRDNESVALALTAAETGHIVLGTLNSNSAPKAIDRIISSFPIEEQPQIRAGLSESLKYVIAQRLLPAKEGRRQVACFEILKGTSNVANMIRDEKTYQIYSAMQIGRSLGMQTSDEALKDLVKRNQISPETAYMAANKKEDFEPLVSTEFLKSKAF
jgi:twitching motility protein PilT